MKLQAKTFVSLKVYLFHIKAIYFVIYNKLVHSFNNFKL